MGVLSYPGFVLLESGQTVSKTLTLDTRAVFRGTLISGEIEPMGGIAVRIPLRGNSPASVKTVTDAVGDFEFFNVPPGEYEMTWDGLPSWSEHVIQVAPPEPPPERQTIATTHRIEHRVLPIPEGWKAPVVLSGKVLTHAGEPLPNMRVVVWRPNSGSTASREAVTGLDGSYSILALPRGTYTASLYNNDFRSGKAIESFTIELKERPTHKDLRLSGPLPVVVR
jgi:protocatechuate 3,4-dioxygenase beta subunit